MPQQQRPQPLSLPHLLIQHARTRPRQSAFTTPQRTATYADLATSTRRLAAQLASLTSPGNRVAVVLPRCIEFVEIILASTRAAAVGVPLDPRSSVAELRWALRDCGPQVVVTDASRLVRVRDAVEGVQDILIVVVGAAQGDLGEAREGATKVVRYEEWAAQEPSLHIDEDKAFTLDSLGLDEPAWLHYTSGTTGTPKGVLSSQRAWLVSAGNYNDALGITAVDKLFWPLPLHHALGHSLCIVGTLVAGMSVYLTGLDEGILNSVLHCEGLTVMAGVPSTYHDLANELALSTGESLESRLLRPRVCISAGGTAPEELRRMMEQILGVPLLDRYGCTESCGAIAAVTWSDIYHKDSCGEPLAHMEVQVMDTNTEVPEAVDSGEEGEIWIRGPSMMLRYWGPQPQQQAPCTDAGWYRTGDLGRRLSGPTGYLKLTGRLNELIRRGSETIHPVEVEQVIRSCPGVQDVVVTGIPHDMLGETPAALIVRTGKSAVIDLIGLLATCRAVLPDYKVPVVFFEIEALPRTKAGKLRRRAAVDCHPRTVMNARHCLTQDMIRHLVLSEVRVVCGLGADEHLDPSLPFAELGMNSLAGVVLRDRLASLSGLNGLPTTLVFEHSTLAALCEYLRGRLFDVMPMPNQAAPTYQSNTSTPSAKDSPEPIAIISMACNYPGSISSPADLWDIVASEADVTTSFPTDRGWDLDALSSSESNRSNPKPGTSITNRGGFLADMAFFDATPFKISPREALATDPQQRLLLETTWHLAERARIAPSALRGTNTGVFVGVMYSGEYANRFLNSGPHELDSHLGLGSAASVAAGRISYTFDLHGPSLAIDTACSSSLVAIHLAAQSLRLGECSLAIAGGVTVMATARPFIMFSRQGGLAPDGRCKSYSASADGTAWSEGVGLLLLERLSDAKRNGHRVLGLVRGSAVNSDGASNGLTAPSGPAQEQVTRAALANAGLAPHDVDVLEGHGTATPLGDAIEAQAVVAAYGSGERESPLLLGSIKSNIGHSQAAAGVAGVIKMVEAMKHGTVPKSLHIDKASSYLANTGRVELATEARPWPHRAKGGPRRAAVSSFGIGGTNSVIILEEYLGEEQRKVRPVHLDTSNPAPIHYPWLLCGADEPGLRAQAGALLAHGACQQQENAEDVAFSLATTRSALSYRAAILPSTGDIRNSAPALAALAQNQHHADVVTGLASGSAPRLAFLFSGQGTLKRHSIKGIKEMCTHFPEFDAAFRAVCSELDPRLTQSLSHVIRAGDEDLLKRTDLSQAIIFAFEVAMFRLLESFGVHPDLVVGHSVGEIAAAHTAGHLSLAGAAALVATRGRLMASLPVGQGIMASISASEEDVTKALAELAGTKETCVIAAVNARKAVVVSGSVGGVTVIVNMFAKQHQRVTLLAGVDHAFHSPLMDPILEELSQKLHNDPTFSSCPRESAKTPLVSTVTGRLADASQLASPEYWTRQVRSPVRFADAVETAASMGATVFLEIGPSAPLSVHVAEAIATQGQPAMLIEALGRLWVRGVNIDWRAIFASTGARVVDLPVYQFQRRRYWLDPPQRSRTSVQDATSAHSSGLASSHPILTKAVPVPGTPGSVVYHGRLSPEQFPWLADHIVWDQQMLPATVFVDMALYTGREYMGVTTMIDELAIVAPLLLMAGKGVMIQVVLGDAKASVSKDDGFGQSVNIYSRPEQNSIDDGWTRHVTGVLKPFSKSPLSLGTHLPMETWQAVDVDLPRAYRALADAGISYGPAFQGVRGVWRSEDGTLLQAKLELSFQHSSPKVSASFDIHPALLDAALHVGMLVKTAEKSGQNVELRLPFLLRGVQIFGQVWGGEPVFVRIPSQETPGEDGVSSLTLVDTKGKVVAIVAEVLTRPWTSAPRETNLFKLTWAPVHATDIWNRVISSSSHNGPDEIIHTRSFRAQHRLGSLPEAVHSETAQVLDTIQQWAMDEAFSSGGRLVIVTEKASTPDPDLAAAAVWGLVRSAQAEFGSDRLVLVDLDGTADSIIALPRAVASGLGVAAIRNGAVMASSLNRVKLPSPSTRKFGPSVSLNTSGTILITGGTGALGALLARHLVRDPNIKSLLLLSRSGPAAPGATTLLADLSSTGATIRILACDVADRAQLSTSLASSLPPVTAIIHTAGILDDGIISAQTPQRVANVLRPKVDAAWLLHELCPDETQLFLFSSAAGVLGNRGQAAYAAGNCFLDGLARYRRARGLHALSLAWGPWENEGGMARGLKSREGVLGAMTDEQGLCAFDAAIRMNGEEAVLVPLLVRGGSVESLPVLGQHHTTSLDKSPGDLAKRTSWRARLTAAHTREDRSIILFVLVRAEVATVLGYEPADILPDRTFSDLGMDSFAAIQLRDNLSVLSGLKGLPATLVLNANTVAALVENLLARFERLTSRTDVQTTMGSPPFDQMASISDQRSSEISQQQNQVASTHAPSRELQGLASLCNSMFQAGHYTAATHVLAAASLILPRFTTFSPHPIRPSPRRLATGPAVNPALVVIPDFAPLAGGGKSRYAALAAAMGTDHDIYELQHPTASVPDSLDALAELHARTVRDVFTGRAVILVGYSAGGCVAHAVAHRLLIQARDGDRLVVGLVLIDTYAVAQAINPDWLMAMTLPAAAVRSHHHGSEDQIEASLAVLGAYLSVIVGWEAGHLPRAVETLFVRASEPLPRAGEGWRPGEWLLADRTVEIPTHHLAILDERHARSVAGVIRKWVAETKIH